MTPFLLYDLVFWLWLWFTFLQIHSITLALHTVKINFHINIIVTTMIFIIFKDFLMLLHSCGDLFWWVMILTPFIWRLMPICNTHLEENGGGSANRSFFTFPPFFPPPKANESSLPVDHWSNWHSSLLPPFMQDTATPSSPFSFVLHNQKPLSSLTKSSNKLKRKDEGKQGITLRI